MHARAAYYQAIACSPRSSLQPSRSPLKNRKPGTPDWEIAPRRADRLSIERDDVRGVQHCGGKSLYGFNSGNAPARKVS